jgi:hypothetical protein
MSWTRKQRITVVAIVLLVAAVPMLWQISNIRAAQATEEKQADLVNQTVTTQHAPNDYDGDGVSDSADVCPTRPETTNGFQDGDGCPDVVATTGAS